MTDFKIVKTKKKVELYVGDRPAVKGSVFLSEFSPRHHGPERVSDLFSAADPFFPFETKDGSICMIRRASVRRMIVDADFELEIIRSYGTEAMIQKKVVITLTDGEEESGTLLIEPREGASRVQDEINRERGFILLDCGKSVQLIGTSFIAMVDEES